MDLKYHIEGIDLRTFARDWGGYTQLDRSRSTASRPVLVNPITKDSIRLKWSEKKNRWEYWNNNPSIPDDHGSVFNFYVHRKDGNLRPFPFPYQDKALYAAGFEFFKDYLGISNGITKGPIGHSTKKTSELFQEGTTRKRSASESRVRYSRTLVPLTEKNIDYLKNERNLLPSTLNNDLFRDTILSSRVKSSKNDHVFTNVAFLRKDPRGHKGGITVHYYRKDLDKNQKLFLDDKRTDELYLWYSNIPENPHAIIYGESEIDCLSHYQLHPSEDPLYLSLNGGYSPEKTKFIHELARSNGIDTIKSITDNDRAGHYIDLETAKGLFNGSEAPFVLETRKETHKLTFKLIIGGHPDKDRIQERLSNRLVGGVPSDTIQLANAKDASFIAIRTDMEEKEKMAIQRTLESIMPLSGYNFTFHKPTFGKDWNEELKRGRRNLKKKEGHDTDIGP